MRKNQKGFSAPEGVLALVIICILFGAFIFVKDKNKITTTPTTSSKSVTATQPKATEKVAVKTEDLTKLPLGDGKVTNTSPQKNYVYSCTTDFRGGGARHAGSWIGTSTWDLTAKPSVEGSVSWPNAKVTISVIGNSRIISGNGLPVDTLTGIFPIKQGTTAYQYDTNPNSIQAQSIYISLPLDPTVAASPTCLGGGPIGYMTNGVALFDGLDAAGRDAAAHEVQDQCDGHPEKTGQYHYHSLSRCLEAKESNNQLLGYALDGFGIYGDKDASGNVITNDRLDECHGMTGEVMWNGKKVSIYHYVINHEYPYSLGCYRGHPQRTR